MPNTHTQTGNTHRACLSSPGCVKNSSSAEYPEVLEEPEPAELGFQYHRHVTPTWPQQQCIPAVLIVKSQMVSLVHRLTQPQRHFINAVSSHGGHLQFTQPVLTPCPSTASSLLNFIDKQVQNFNMFTITASGIYFK